MPVRSSTTRPTPSIRFRFTLGGAAALLALHLAACGNTGPLYLPNEPAGSAQPPTDEVAEQNERER